MTGEMRHIDRDGNDSNGETWETHALLARALRGKLRPFDVYTGPYIEVEEGYIFLDYSDGAVEVVLWPGGHAPAYVTPYSEPAGLMFDDDPGPIIDAARAMLRRYRREQRAERPDLTEQLNS